MEQELKPHVEGREGRTRRKEVGTAGRVLGIFDFFFFKEGKVGIWMRSPRETVWNV